MCGFGVIFFQDKGFIEYRSKFLIEIEICYLNIEREMFVIVYGFEKFYYYVYG